MSRGIRGATTVTRNEENEILAETKKLLQKMIIKNNIQPGDLSHIFISVTNDLNATFPAKALRQIGEEWKFVPIMCMKEIDVPGSLEKCIRVMMVANITTDQKKVQHVFLNDAVRLRPDLVEEGDSL